MANPLPLVALAGENLSLTASSFSIADEDPDYPATNFEEFNPARVTKSTANSANVSIITTSASVVGVVLINTNATTANVTGGLGVESITIPALDLDGQRKHGWVDLRETPLGPSGSWSVGLAASSPVFIGHIALLTALHPFNLKYGLKVGETRPGDTRHRTRLGTRLDYGAQIRTRWAKGMVDLEEDETLIRNLYASAKGGILPFILIPDEAANDAWLVKFDDDFSLTYANYGVREMPVSLEECSSGPPNG